MIIDVDTGALASEVSDAPMSREAERILHQTIKKVSEDIESLDYNTAISQLMIFVNEFSRMPQRNKTALETFVLLLSPLAPHIAEELWQRLGHPDTLAYHPWPKFDPAKLTVDEVEILVQINGKPRARIKAPASADADALCALALADETVQAQTAGTTIVKSIGVPGRLVNLVVK